VEEVGEDFFAESSRPAPRGDIRNPMNKTGRIQAPTNSAIFLRVTGFTKVWTFPNQITPINKLLLIVIHLYVLISKDPRKNPLRALAI